MVRRHPHREEHRPRAFPSHDYGLNKAWLDAAMIACILMSWLKFLALDGDLARAEPKTLRYRILAPRQPAAAIRPYERSGLDRTQSGRRHRMPASEKWKQLSDLSPLWPQS